jgi:putative DNA methylase
MPIHHRRLPHISEPAQPVFLTWRLHGTLPANRTFPPATTSGKSFALMDQLLDNAQFGPSHLKSPAIAQMLIQALHHCQNSLHHHTLHAYVIMPNHVHLLCTPRVPLPQLTHSLKSFTATQANQILAQTGSPFWQQESYDHLIRNQPSFEKIKRYIENNPVKARLATTPETYPYSSSTKK